MYYIFFFNLFTLKGTATINVLQVILSWLSNFQTSFINHICMNSPYVQTTNEEVIPPKKIQNEPVFLSMLIKWNTRKSSSWWQVSTCLFRLHIRLSLYRLHIRLSLLRLHIRLSSTAPSLYNYVQISFFFNLEGHLHRNTIN